MADAPSVGIFWFVADTAGATRLLALGHALSAAEPYSDCLTFPDGHAEVWEAWRRRDLPLPVAASRPIVAATEYDEWPRGRVVFDTATGRFVIYADRQLPAPARVARVISAFALPPGRTIVGADPHFGRAWRLPTSDGTA